MIDSNTKFFVSLGKTETEDGDKIVAKFLDKFNFSYQEVVACLLCLYSVFENVVSDSEQLAFEQNFINLFNKSFPERNKYSENLNTI